MKNIEQDDRFYADMQQICDRFDSSSIKKYLSDRKTYSEDKLEHMDMTSPDKGKKLFLEVTVENSLYASSLFSWLYSKSEYKDGKDNLKLLGCNLDKIWFSPPGLNDELINAIKILNNELDKLQGN